MEHPRVHKSIPFWPYLHCRFSLGPDFASQRPGFVIIYNKKGQNGNDMDSIKSASKYCIAGWAREGMDYSFCWKLAIMKHPTGQASGNYKTKSFRSKEENASKNDMCSV